jgi:hypothetical protein
MPLRSLLSVKPSCTALYPQSTVLTSAPPFLITLPIHQLHFFSSVQPDVASRSLAALFLGTAEEGGLHAPVVTPLWEALLHRSVPSEHRADESAFSPFYVDD